MGVSFFFAVTGLFTVYFIYILGKETHSARTGLLAALFYSTSFTMITYDKNIWEPFRLPFFIILAIYFLFLSQREKSIQYLTLAAVFYVFSLMYITGWLLFPAFAFFYLFFSKKLRSRKNMSYSVFQFALLLILLYLPVFVYEAGHNYPTFNFLIYGSSHYFSLNLFGLLNSFFTHVRLFLDSMFQSYYYYPYYLSLFFFLTLVYLKTSYFKIFNLNSKISIILIMFLSGFLITSIYSPGKDIYVWRLALLYPLFILLFAYFISVLVRKVNRSKSKEYGYLLFVVSIISIRYLFNNFYLFGPGYVNFTKTNYDNYIKVAEYISDSSKEKIFQYT